MTHSTSGYRLTTDLIYRQSTSGYLSATVCLSACLLLYLSSLWPGMQDSARIFKFSRSPGIDSEESTPPDWELIPGLLKRFTNTGSGVLALEVSLFLTPTLYSTYCRAES
jgi:hypothetical protein